MSNICCTRCRRDQAFLQSVARSSWLGTWCDLSAIGGTGEQGVWPACPINATSAEIKFGMRTASDGETAYQNPVYGIDIYNGMRYNVTHDTVIPKSRHGGYL